jgi:TetR/AcrR family transcriptional regulator
MAKARLTRKEREKIRHKEEILAAALHLFSSKGFHNVSVQEIAQASEFAVGTLYNFFESKEMLFDEMARDCGEKITSTLLAVLDGPGTEVERLTNLIRYLPTLLEEHADFIRMYVSELGTRGAMLSKRRVTDNYKTAFNPRLEQLLESGMRKGVFRRVDPRITMQAINSIIETLAFEIAGRFDRNEAKEMFDKVEKLFVGGLLLPEGRDNG